MIESNMHESKKVTDLEGFALREVMSPFWPNLVREADYPQRRRYRLDSTQQHYRRLVHSLGEVSELLEYGPAEWRMDVCTRLARCGFWFPDYIDHHLVRVARSGMATAEANRAATNTWTVDVKETIE